MQSQQIRQSAGPGSTQHTPVRSFTQPRVRQQSYVQRDSVGEHRRAVGLARFLGWFSIGLGLAEVAAPRGIAKLVGVRGDHHFFIRFLGMREIASGIGILTQRNPTEGVWSRVGGDAIDLACLGAAYLSPRARQDRVAVATAAVLGVTLLDALCARKLSRRAFHVQQSIMINRSPAELYQFWHEFQNLPRFMYHLESVQTTGQGRSHWVTKAPARATVEWDAVVTADHPNSLIAWRSLEGADVEHTGSVRFEPAPGGRGTVVTVEITYRPPGGAIGRGLATLFGEAPEQQLRDDLRRFKQVMETGEVIRSEGSLQGMGVVTQRPAQPPAGKNGQ
jgi:uncharacterized membrane protein